MQLNYINTILKDASGLFKVGYNGLGLGVVPPCTNFDFSTKLSGGITPNPCYMKCRLIYDEAQLKTKQKNKKKKKGWKIF